MVSLTLYNQLEEATATLIAMAEKMIWNKLSKNNRFILTEIKNANRNFYEQRKARKKENGTKSPALMEEVMPTLNSLYKDIYDINLHIYKAAKNETIIEISYYLKSSLRQDYQQRISNNPPMIHCKVATPPWLLEKKKKFDINWEHKELLTRIMMFWQRVKLKIPH